MRQIRRLIVISDALSIGPLTPRATAACNRAHTSTLSSGSSNRLHGFVTGLFIIGAV